MKPYHYQHKPLITSPIDLLSFLNKIPAAYWCAHTRDDDEGRHCVLGHLDKAYGYGCGRDGFTEVELAIINNGVTGPNANWSLRIKDISLSGLAIKRRVLKYIRQRIQQPTE